MFMLQQRNGINLYSYNKVSWCTSYDNRKVLRIKVSLRYVISLLMGCVGIIIVSAVCNVFLTSFIVNLFVKILMSIIVYITALLALKNDAALSMVNGFLVKIKK